MPSTTVSEAVARVVAATTNIENAGDSLIASYNSIAQTLRDMEPTRDELDALADRLENQAAEIAAANLANTPAAPPA